MLTSSLIEDPVPYVLHTVHGTPTPEEMVLAVHHALQHAEVPVLWDVRGLDPEAELSQYEDRLRSLVRSAAQQPASRKRAFVVTAASRPVFESFLERLEFAGPWAAFASYKEALIWLRG